MQNEKTSPMSFTSYQIFVVAILAFLQFTIVLDFMILSPLGAILMPALKITPQQFGLAVSVYAFSAGTSGILAAGFADRFDRKRLLLFFYVGFMVGTLLCAIAPTYYFLLFARMVTGVFGGVMGSIVFAITTDLFVFQQRGRVMGFVQTAFAGSQVLGLPAGLYLANHWGWHSPFFLIDSVAVIVGFVIITWMKPIDEHLKKKPDRSPIHHLIDTITTPRYIQGFCATALLGMGGYMLMPFGSAFMVNNVGISLDDLPLLYVITGAFTIFTGPLVGKLADTIGKFNTFIFGTAVSVVMVIVYTNLGHTTLTWMVVVNAVLFVGIFSRMIPSQALMSAIPAPQSRGSYMSISAALTQMSGGLGAMVAGFIVYEGAGGRIEHYPQLGYVVIASSLITLVMMYFISKLVPESGANQPIVNIEAG